MRDFGARPKIISSQRMEDITDRSPSPSLGSLSDRSTVESPTSLRRRQDGKNTRTQPVRPSVQQRNRVLCRMDKNGRRRLSNSFH
jgi:hypothetical protein